MLCFILRHIVPSHLVPGILTEQRKTILALSMEDLSLCLILFVVNDSLELYLCIKLTVHFDEFLLNFEA